MIKVKHKEIDVTAELQNICKVIFFNENGILAEFDRLPVVATIDELTKKITDRYVNKNIDLLIDDPLRAIKINYNKKNNFWVKSKEKYKTGIDLYIYIDNKINTITNKGQYIVMESETETNYLDIYELKYNDEVMFLQSSYYTNIIKNELGQRIDELQQEFNKLNIDISSYDLRKLLSNYNIIKIKA